MMQFRQISHRLLATVGAVVILGIVALTITYAMRQEAASLQQNERALALVTDSVAEGLAALMQGGHAKAAPDFAERLRNVPNIIDYRIIRLDGTQAFIDNTTLEQVRDRLGHFEFFERRTEPVQIVAATDPNLDRMRKTGEPVFDYHIRPGGERLVTVFSPIYSATGCHKCHGADEALRGAVTFTVSMQHVDRDVERTWQLSVVVIALAMLAMVSLIYWFAHRTVGSQLIAFLAAMETVAKGDNFLRLDVPGRDEISDMARAFNHMNENLLETYEKLKEEQIKLNTVIFSAGTGIVVTDGAQQVVLVNAAAEAILGRSAPEIVERGFLQLFDDPAWMQARIGLEPAQTGASIREWKGRILSVRASTIANSNGRAIGSAVLMRDITEEKRLEERLKQQSITDTLTGIFNRRYFDDVIATEFKRWKRYAQPVSVMMIDIDHFKQFNDAHGHDCGDHVLAAIGKVLEEFSAPAQIPCRYGGEEMAIVMPGVIEQDGARLAEAIRQRVSELEVDGLRVTVSIGVAGLPGHQVDSADALMKLADDALYVAKHKGRNQVCLAAAG